MDVSFWLGILIGLGDAVLSLYFLFTENVLDAIYFLGLFIAGEIAVTNSKITETKNMSG